MLLAVAAACAGETVEVPGETVVVERVVTETVEVPGETVVVEKEVIKTVEVPGETVTKEVVKEVMVPGETVVVEKEVVKTVEVPGETVTVEVVKEVMVPGETVVVEKEVVKTVEVPGQTVVVEKVVVQEVPGKKYVTDPTTGKVVSAPQYGGTFTFAGWGAPDHSDSFYANMGYVTGVLEKLSQGDWAVDREVYAWESMYVPWDLVKPFLLESWSQPDPLTVVMKVRRGVHWQDKPPVNGREFTAKDIEYNYHRFFGMGSGFTEISSYFKDKVPSLESITATDKYTVVFNLGKPQLDAVEKLVTEVHAWLYAPEVIEQYGDAKDWMKLVGTGPFELEDNVPGSSTTYVKNPNYWGYDEKYPENILPYVDEMRVLTMGDPATKSAAMRSRKIDGVGLGFGSGWSNFWSLDPVVSLARTNPEMVITPIFMGSETSFTVNTQVPPWDDVRVRRALQMAINLEEINRTYWRGYAETTPQTWMSSQFLGYVVPFEDWPEETKQYYRYDPAAAEALLDEVGLKRGADGIRLSTTLLMHTGSSEGGALDHSYVVKEYWKAIGIELETEVIDVAIHRELTDVTKDWEGIISSRAGYTAPIVGQFETLSVNFYGGYSQPNWNDPVYDAMVLAIRDATSIVEQQRVAREASLYIAEQHVTIWGSLVPYFNVVQPWLKGFNGEVWLAVMDYNPMVARLWIDSEMKAAMGH